MKPQYRYLRDEKVFKDDAQLALRDRFASRAEFDAFYDSLGSDEIKNEFLRAATAYLFFVKNGDWKVQVPRSNEVISYFTNSFKLVALMGVIESLSSEKFLDFYAWLNKKPDEFPIEEPKELAPLYMEYKKDYGSIRRCKRFFSNLPGNVQSSLLNSVTVDGQTVTKIEKFAEMLYRVRSGFAHEVDNAAEVSGGYVINRVDGKTVVWNLSMDELLHAFEVGLLTHFNDSWKCT